jgi:GntR family transcriptional regulator
MLRGRRVAEAPKSRSRYRELADELRQAIARGQYPPGSKLPGEPELADRFGVSRPVVNRALAILRNEGLVRPEHGRGTFVHPLPPILRSANLRYGRQRRESGGTARGAFDAEVRALGYEPRSELVQVGPVTPPDEVAEALALSPGDVALIRRRHMSASETPVQVATSYIPWDLARNSQLTQADTGPGGTYSRLAELGHPIARFRERVTVRTPSANDASWLRLAEEQRVYTIFHVAFDDQDKPVEVTIHVMPTHQWVLDYEWPAESRELGTKN